jgi:hypothetical protein
MVVNYSVNGSKFVSEKPRTWSAKQLANTGSASNGDLAPDGKRFAVLMPAESPGPLENRSHIKLVTNYFAEVRRRLGEQTK